ncbi:unnamed protein product [Leptosia nina]|uniref:Uncharacterized protein n=1 Tax=Leptosia nina TaxID=320188 RepID=A0AAV1K2V8_9NEOP
MSLVNYRIVPGSTTFRHSKLRYSSRVKASPVRARQSVKAASLSRIESTSGGGGDISVGGARPGSCYGYEALSAASDGSEAEAEYAPFDLSGEPSSRGSCKVNFPPELDLERRTAPPCLRSRSRARSMSAWSDVSRSSIRFEERLDSCYETKTIVLITKLVQAGLCQAKKISEVDPRGGGRIAMKKLQACCESRAERALEGGPQNVI